MTNHNGSFPGFPPKPVTNYWPYPKALNGWWHSLTASEQKVLDYLLRHTWGFKKNSDMISLSQFMKGITKKNGEILDTGTGLKDKKTIRGALKGLENKGFIQSIPKAGNPNLYVLKINPSQNLTPLPNSNSAPQPKNNTPPLPNTGTHNKETIKNNNTYPASQANSNSFKSEVSLLISHLSSKLDGVKFPNYGKQAKFAKSMLDAEYSCEDIKWAIDKMAADSWWSDNSFDMKNVADQIPKLMTKTFKEKENK